MRIETVLSRSAPSPTRRDWLNCAKFVIPAALRRQLKAGTMQKLLAQIMKFGVVGVVATVIDFGIMNLLHYGLGLNILIANTSGFIVSLIFNYRASMKYVFAHKEGISRRREFIIFVVLSVIGLVLNDGIVLAFNAGLGLEANIAKICATALVMVYNFVTQIGRASCRERV